MNRLLSVDQVAQLLNMEHLEHRFVQRRLRVYAAERRTEFQFFRLGKFYYTTEEDLRRLIPELFAHEERDADSMRARIEALVSEVKSLKRKTEVLENTLFRLQTEAKKGA
ncbi:hypothetical protein BE20_24960 [Sorangium cellulosum]|uniref:MerR family transcriptional regulator n=1 Tax=Sorangium cellulosum TaxID=56 RepID=A0A150SA41_SORCE|nr:hypothetical protein BE20_24960 [Sorangium cellulosum]KYF89267.1 hypothetical protein BE18_22810 [Sorangium cellulosum]